MHIKIIRAFTNLHINIFLDKHRFAHYSISKCNCFEFEKFRIFEINIKLKQFHCTGRFVRIMKR